MRGGLEGQQREQEGSSIKRHLAVDTPGQPHVVAMSAAEVTDRTKALQTLRCSKDTL